jgi:exosortase A
MNTNRVMAAFAFAIALSFLAFHDAWLGMMRVWMSSETFTHGFIAVPFSVWMIWRHRADWRHLPTRGWWPALLVMAVLAAGWTVGHIAGVASVEQLAAVAMIPAALAALVGLPVVMALAFPLAFLFFAVPIGEFLTPLLMDYTADATVLALQWTGIPVYREGLHFTVPSGRWSVVEACSGLRYLIASLALGVMFAYMQFRTLKYRLAFMALSLIVPIIANWIRAYLIVMIGHLSNMKLAAGADHLVYGWVFFGLVMGLLFWIGSRWNEPAEAGAGADSPRGSAPADESPAGTPAGAAGAALRLPARITGLGSSDAGELPAAQPALPAALRPLLVTAAVALLIALAARPVANAMLDATEPVSLGASIAAALGPGAAIATDSAAAPALDWAPIYVRPVDAVRATLDTAAGTVEAHAFYYARQHEGQEMIHGANNVQPLSSPKWPIRARAQRATDHGPVEELRIGHGGNELLVWHWYQIAGHATTSPYEVKARTALALFTGQGDHSVAIALATPVAGAGAQALAQARQALAEAATRLAPAAARASRGEAGAR